MVDDYLRQYGLIAILAVIAVALPVSMVLLSWLAGLLGVRPRKPSLIKSSIYECGMAPIGGPRVQFNFRYYIFALLFVAFDVVVVFLYPWATRFRQLEGFALAAMAVFILVLLLGWIYAWRKRALEWE